MLAMLLTSKTYLFRILLGYPLDHPLDHPQIPNTKSTIFRYPKCPNNYICLLSTYYKLSQMFRF